MEDIQANVNINFISDQMYNEASLQLILLNLFGGNYVNFNFKITDGNKVMMEDSAALINGQIYLFKGGTDITDIIEEMPSGMANRINAFLIYDYDYDLETDSNIVSNPKLSLTNESGGGQITAPVGVFIKNDNDHTVEWVKTADDELNALLYETTIVGDVIEATNDGWKENDVITFPNNILKYQRIYLYARTKSGTSYSLSNNLQIGIVPDSWSNDGKIIANSGYGRDSDNVTFQVVFDNYKNDIGGEALPSNQVKLRSYKSFRHNLSAGKPHQVVAQSNLIYKIKAYRY